MFPRSRWAIVRKDLPTIKRNVVPAFDKVRVGHFDGLVGELHKGDWEYTTSTGSKIILFPEGYQDDKELNRWRGLEVNGFLLEEANELQEASFTKAQERAGTWIVPNGTQPPPLILMTANPSKNWLKSLMYDPWQKGELEHPYGYIPASPADNPYLPPEYLDNLEEMRKRSPLAYAKFVLGDWDVSEGDTFKADNFPVRDVSMDGWTMGLFADMAYTKKKTSDECAFGLAGIDAAGNKHMFRIKMDRMDENESIGYLIRTMKEHQAEGRNFPVHIEAHSAYLFALKERMKVDNVDFIVRELKPEGVPKADRILNFRHGMYRWTYDKGCQKLINQFLDWSPDLMDVVLDDGCDMASYADRHLVYDPGQQSAWVPPRPDPVSNPMGAEVYDAEMEQREQPKASPW